MPLSHPFRCHAVAGLLAAGSALLAPAARADQATVPMAEVVVVSASRIAHTDRAYICSLVVGDTNKRYYEAAPARNAMVGASVAYVF